MNKQGKNLSSKILDWWSILLGFIFLFFGIAVIRTGEFIFPARAPCPFVIYTGITSQIGAAGIFLLSYFLFRFRFWKRRESKIVSVCLCIMIPVFFAALLIADFRGQFSYDVGYDALWNPQSPHTSHTPRLTLPK
jgi:hypothetical protein